MAQVIVEGVFMGAGLKTSEYDGVKKTKGVVDIYQQHSEQSNKTVQLSTDDLELYEKLKENHSMGDIVKVTAGVNAYKNQAYYKLLAITE